MSTTTERDFPVGHPKAADYDPLSPEAKEWARVNIHPLGQRDFPVGHIKALDTPGNLNHLSWTPGVDPTRPTIEAFTGATAEVAAARKALEQAQAASAQETPTTPEGFVDTGKIAHESAIAFLEKLGHSKEEAAAIISEQGLDKVLAARSTLKVEG